MGLPQPDGSLSQLASLLTVSVEPDQAHLRSAPHQAQAETVFSQAEAFLGPSPPYAGTRGLLTSVPDLSTSQAVALPASALPPPADYECPGQDTEKERQWVKTKVRKYSSGFPWELFILIRTYVSTLRAEPACEMK